MEAQSVVDVASKLTKARDASLRWRAISEDPNTPVGTSMSHNYPMNDTFARGQLEDGGSECCGCGE